MRIKIRSIAIAFLWIVVCLLYVTFSSNVFALILLGCSVITIIYLIVSIVYVTRNLQVAATESKSVNDKKIVLTITNKAHLPINYVQCEISLRHRFTGEIVKQDFSTHLKRKATNIFEMKLPDYFGEYDVEIKEMIIFDELKLFSSSKFLALELAIQNKRISLSTSHFLNQYDVFSTLVNNQLADEKFQIKPYIPGDSVKNIHWKLSQRLDEVMVWDITHSYEKVFIFIDLQSATSMKDYDSLITTFMDFCTELLFQNQRLVVAWHDEANKEYNLENTGELSQVMDWLLSQPKVEQSFNEKLLQQQASNYSSAYFITTSTQTIETLTIINVTAS